MSSTEELEQLVEFAVYTAQASGEIALKYFRADPEVSNKQESRRFDPVTLADTEVEAFIRERIREQFPEHTVIGEEAGETTGSGDVCWFIDPVDGTRGFVAGSPMWGTLLGMMKGDTCALGLMHQPFVGETFVGSELGAFRITGDERTGITTSRTGQIADAVLCCTHLSMFHTARSLDRFIGMAEACRFSRFGTDCYGYAMLAQGTADLVVEGGLKHFDIMPLIPLVEAAGGVVTDWEGNSVAGGGDVVAAANASLHEQALELLSSRS